MNSLLKRLCIVLLALVVSCAEKRVGSDDDASRYTIVYVSPLDDRLIEMNADGSNKRPLGDFTGSQPRYTLDGKRIAALHWVDNPREKWLVLYDPQNQSIKKLAFIKGLGFNPWALDSYAWSKDGTRLAFMRATGERMRADIYVVDSAGRAENRLTNSGWNIGPHWSQDSKTIFYYLGSDSGMVGYLMNDDGSNKRIVPYRPPGLAFDLQWNPDGELISFDGKFDSTIVSKGNTDVYMTDPDGLATRRITFDGVSGKTRWSPDGSKILYLSGVDGARNICVMNRDGSGRRDITTHGKAFVSELLWSPDGKKIAYVYEVTPREKYSIHVVNADGSDDVDTEADIITHFFDWEPK